MATATIEGCPHRKVRCALTTTNTDPHFLPSGVDMSITTVVTGTVHHYCGLNRDDIEGQRGCDGYNKSKGSLPIYRKFTGPRIKVIPSK